MKYTLFVAVFKCILLFILEKCTYVCCDHHFQTNVFIYFHLTDMSGKLLLKAVLICKTDLSPETTPTSSFEIWTQDTNVWLNFFKSCILLGQDRINLWLGTPLESWNQVLVFVRINLVIVGASFRSKGVVAEAVITGRVSLCDHTILSSIIKFAWFNGCLSLNS